MKQDLQIMLGARTTPLLAFAALGQAAPISKTDGWEYLHERMARARPDRLAGAAKASDVIGMRAKRNVSTRLEVSLIARHNN